MNRLYSDDNANGIGEAHSTRIECKLSLVHENVSTMHIVSCKYIRLYSHKENQKTQKTTYSLIKQ